MATAIHGTEICTIITIVFVFVYCIQIRKPMMEKKRRARINHSLDELKRIVVNAEKSVSRTRKLYNVIRIRPGDGFFFVI